MTAVRNVLLSIADSLITVMVVEQKERLTHGEFHSIERVLPVQGRSLEVGTVSENPIADSAADLMGITYTFCSRLSMRTDVRAPAGRGSFFTLRKGYCLCIINRKMTRWAK
jgi:predicted site-specific integrase-resolvase